MSKEIIKRSYKCWKAAGRGEKDEESEEESKESERKARMTEEERKLKL